MKAKLLLAFLLFAFCYYVSAFANNVYFGTEYQQRSLKYYHQLQGGTLSHYTHQGIAFVGIEATDNFSLELSHQSTFGGKRLMLLSSVPRGPIGAMPVETSPNDILKINLLRLKGPTLSFIWRFPLRAFPSVELTALAGVSSLKAVFEHHLNGQSSKHNLHCYGLKIGTGVTYKISDKVYGRGTIYFEHPHFINLQDRSPSSIFSSVPRYSMGLMYKF